MGNVTTLDEHGMSKYHDHTLRNIGLGLGIPAGLAIAFFGIRALTSDHSTNSEKVQKALHSDPGAKTDVMQNPSQYQQQAIKDLNNKMTQLYFDKNLASEESDNLVLDFQEGTGQRTPPFKTVATTRLSKGEMRKIDKGRVDELWPGFKKAWFAQIELKDGGYGGYFVIEQRGRKSCYRELSPNDPMYRIVVKQREIYR